MESLKDQMITMKKVRCMEFIYNNSKFEFRQYHTKIQSILYQKNRKKNLRILHRHWRFSGVEQRGNCTILKVQEEKIEYLLRVRNIFRRGISVRQSVGSGMEKTCWPVRSKSAGSTRNTIKKCAPKTENFRSFKGDPNAIYNMRKR